MLMVAYILADLFFILFADSAITFIADKSLYFTTNIVSEKQRVTLDWFLVNKLCGNIRKTHCTFFDLTK